MRLRSGCVVASLRPADVAQAPHVKQSRPDRLKKKKEAEKLAKACGARPLTSTNRSSILVAFCRLKPSSTTAGVAKLILSGRPASFVLACESSVSTTTAHCLALVGVCTPSQDNARQSSRVAKPAANTASTLVDHLHRKHCQVSSTNKKHIALSKLHAG